MADQNYDELSLEGQVAIVTGGGRELGKAMALRLAGAGADIVIADLCDVPDPEIADTMQKLGRRLLFVQTDVSQNSQVADCVMSAIDEFGRVDILINNAGIAGKTAPVQDQSEADWDAVLNVDLKGVFLFCHHTIPHMLKQKSGRIVNIASIAGKEGNPNMGPYCAAKAGVIALTKSIGKELAGTGILVNAIAPSVFNTRLLNTLTKENVEWLLEQVPMARFGNPREIAALVHFMVSGMCTFSTGFCFDISGGRATY